MFSSTNERWKNALHDLSCFDDVTDSDERRRLFEEIFALSTGPLTGHEERICEEFHELARRLRVSLGVHQEKTVETVAAVGDLCDHLGKQLLIFEENSARALVGLFLDSLPDYELITDDTLRPRWISLLNGLASVLYQTGVFILTSRVDILRLQKLFKLVVDPQIDPHIRCPLTQSCVNIVLPTQTGIDPDKFLINDCMMTLLRILKEDELASKCKLSAHMILVAIKGISRIIERISSRNEFVAPNDLTDLLAQTINWSLFMLRGAQPFDKTIRRQQLPEEVIPKDDKGPEHQRAKRKKPMTRRRFRPADQEQALMDVSEVSEKLPWLAVTSSSDSESDTGGDADGQAEERKLRQKWGCIRQASLLTLKIIVKNTGKRHLCQYWTSFLPSCTKLPNEVVEKELDQSNCGLIISILSDPAPKARNLAVEVLRHFIQQCKQFISKVCTQRRSGANFISLGESVNISIERLHYLLIFALQKEFKRKPTSNQEIMLINQLYSTLRATVEATNYAMFSSNLLRYCVEKVIVLDRCAAQLQFLKSIANERSAPKAIENLFSATWGEITNGERVDYYINDKLSDVPWPIATSHSQLWYSYEHETPLQYCDQRNRVSVEEEALDLLQSFSIHHFCQLEHHHQRVLDIVKIVLNSEMAQPIIAASFRLLQTINSQSKQWRLNTNANPEDDSPVPIRAFKGLWTFLIDNVLARYLFVANQQTIGLIEPALEAVSHIEPEVFQHLSKHQQAWIMTVMPGMCDHNCAEVQSKAIHALGDLVLIRGLRQDENFLSNITELLVRKTDEARSIIFQKSSTNPNASKVRNDLIYGIACLSDAMRSTMLENYDEFQRTPFVYEVFSPEDICYCFQLMHSVKDFYDNITAADRTKPQAIRAVGGFLQMAPVDTPPEIIKRLVQTLENAIREKNAKLVWNGAKAAEYFFGNEQTAWLDPAWSNTLLRALSFAMKNHKNNKVKINCLTALNIRRVQSEILSRPEQLIQIFHDCVDVAEAVPQMVTQVGEIDYRSKLRDLCCESVTALAQDLDNTVLQQIIQNRREMLTPVFEEYVNHHGYGKLDSLTKKNKTVLQPILQSLDLSNNNILFNIPTEEPIAS